EIMDDQLADELWQHSARTEKWFKRIYSDARPAFDAFFQETGEERPSISGLIREFKNSSVAFWGFGRRIYTSASERQCDAETVRGFWGVCPPFGVLVFTLFVALYERCVGDEKTAESYRAGPRDLFSAVYLPYCDVFVTDDDPQDRCLQSIVVEAQLEAEIR